MKQENEVMLGIGVGCNEPDILDEELLLDWAKDKKIWRRKRQNTTSHILRAAKKCEINKQTNDDSQHSQICHCSIFTPVGQKNPNTEIDIL